MLEVGVVRLALALEAELVRELAQVERDRLARLQPCEMEAATVCNSGCNRM